VGGSRLPNEAHQGDVIELGGIADKLAKLRHQGLLQTMG
jgi:hypothetical protein